MLTAWCIAVVLLTPLVVGIPLRSLLGWNKALDQRAWLEIPFVGIAGLILPLQTLVYLDIPVRVSMPFFLGFVLLGWLQFGRWGQPVAGLRACPWKVMLAVVVVYLVQGRGLLSLGAEHYVGRAWSDMINYIGVADFVHSQPQSAPITEFTHQPHLANACCYKEDRLGQSVFHAALMVLTGCDAKPLFGPMILLGISLVVLPVFALLRRLDCSDFPALSTAILAGLSPALTLVHLECFLSQALAIPLLLMIPVLLADLIADPRWSHGLVAALVAATLGDIYTELLPIVEALIVGFLLVSCLDGRCSLRSLGWLILVASAPIWLNPLYLPRLQIVLDRLGTAAMPSDHYPWAFELEGLGRLWFGDLVAGPSGTSRILVFAGSALTLLAALGFLRSVPTFWRARRLS